MSDGITVNVSKRAFSDLDYRSEERSQDPSMDMS